MSYVMCLWRFPPLHIILSIGKVYFDVALLLLPPHLSLDVVMASHSDCDVTWLVGNTQDAVWQLNFVNVVWGGEWQESPHFQRRVYVQPKPENDRGCFDSKEDVMSLEVCHPHAEWWKTPACVQKVSWSFTFYVHWCCSNTRISPWRWIKYPLSISPTGTSFSLLGSVFPGPPRGRVGLLPRAVWTGLSRIHQGKVTLGFLGFLTWSSASLRNC